MNNSSLNVNLSDGLLRVSGVGSNGTRVMLLAGIVALAFLVLSIDPLAWSQQHTHHEHPGMSMPANEPTEGLLLDWKRITYSARVSLSFTYRFGKSASGAKSRTTRQEQQDIRIENR